MAKTKSGGGKKGERKAKKADYVARCSGASRKGRNKKKTGGIITSKNKARRKAKHEKLVGILAEKKSKRLELTDEAKTQLRKRAGDLQKKFGTLNINRLTDVLNGTYETSDWYLVRVARNQANEEAKRERKRFRKKPRKNKVRKVPKGRDKRNREVSVDKKRGSPQGSGDTSRD